ncbi:AraC family transcriptional regulator [Salipiger bermudensis]|uniref:helix-turn-helix domain-containing protein n=1 Tax=Salipiger bermudensis TaxID=344736 RepID=UPI001C99218D|nr:AraC family transcriptional regulator [Salipiger bermudensis]MBY6006686.1 AraC family transcriptional regulator [Salipiger bermudensis]
MGNRLAPTLSITVAHPFVDALFAHGVLREEVAEHLGVPVEALNDQAFRVPANTLYRFCRWSVEKVGDPYLAARLGQRMANGGWAPVLTLLRESKSLIAFLTSISNLTERHGGPLAYRLEAEGPNALWKLVRADIGVYEAEYADATAVGFFTEILRRAAGTDWDHAGITAITTNASLIPRDILPGTCVLTGVSGIAIRFPSAWLAYPMPAVGTRDELHPIDLEHSLPDTVGSVCVLIERHLSDENLTIDKVASLIGMTRWHLQSALSEAGTNFAALKTELRIKLAKEALTSSEAGISEVATSLGYSNVSNFSRAFRDWTGVSPRQFRNAGRGEPAPGADSS